MRKTFFVVKINNNNPTSSDITSQNNSIDTKSKY